MRHQMLKRQLEMLKNSHEKLIDDFIKQID